MPPHPEEPDFYAEPTAAAQYRAYDSYDSYDCYADPGPEPPPPWYRRPATVIAAAELGQRITEHRAQHRDTNRDGAAATTARRAAPVTAGIPLARNDIACSTQSCSGLVRTASARDAVACLGIYRPYVDTAISWETEVPPVSEMAARIDAAHEWLVLERERRVIGFAYGHTLHRLPAFQWSVETGIYVDVNHQRADSGRMLYTELLSRLTARGFRQAFAGITQPNAASNAFHRSFGYTDAGLYRRASWKQHGWHDVAWMQLELLGNAAQDEPPRPIVDLGPASEPEV